MERLACDAIHNELLRKLRLLMEHYGIANKDDWFSLAVALATDHVPGCQIEWPLVKLPPGFSGPVIIPRARKKGGRPPEWDIHRLERLLSAVESEKARHAIETDREALSRLARRQEWSRPANHRGTLDQWIETLEARLQEAKRFRRLLQNAESGLREAIEERNSGNR
jgi:hypothetical protein